MKKNTQIYIIIALIVLIFLIGYGKNLIPRKNVNIDSACRDKTLQIQELTEIKPMGDERAPILLEVYSDFQCGFCIRYYVNAIKPLIKEYIETGKSKLLYKDMAFEGDRSQWAAEAVHCANDQDKFWEFHDKISITRYQTNSAQIYDKANLIKTAQELGLDQCEFALCLESGKYQQLVKNNTKEAFKQINGTPTTFLNGKMVADIEGKNVGAMPYADLKFAIDNALKSL